MKRPVVIFDGLGKITKITITFDPTEMNIPKLKTEIGGFFVSTKVINADVSEIDKGKIILTQDGNPSYRQKITDSIVSCWFNKK